jgi:outer membrane protein TolC
MRVLRGALTLALLLATVAFTTRGASAEATGIVGRTLTLQECVALGLKQNPATEIARQNLQAAREKVGEARGGSYPTLRFSAGYTYTTPPEGAAGAAADNFDNRFYLKQNLYDGGQTASLVAGAEHGIRALESDLAKTGLDLVLNIHASFYEVLRRRDFIEIARQAFASSEKHVGQAQELYQQGLAPRSDVIKAEVQVSTGQLEIIRAENAYLLAKANLSVAMGLPVTTEFTVAAPESGAEPAVPPLAEALAAAPVRRPELAAVRARQDVAEAAVRQARSGLYPTVSLDASYGWQESDFVPLDTKWSVGFTVSIPVFERRVARARVNQALAGRDGLRAAETQALRSVELEVEQAWLLLKEALERRSVTLKILEQTEADIRVSEGRYQEGLGTMLEVIDARTMVAQAGVNAVIARYDIAQARARLERALGTGLPAEGAQ